MNKTLINKIQVYHNQTTKKDLKKLFFDETGSIYLSDGYSIIKFFDTKYNRKNRQCLIENIKSDNSINKHLTKQVINYYNNFINDEFNIQTKIISNNKEYCKFENNKLEFDTKKIKAIKRIIGNNDNINYFRSEKEENAICFVGKNGIAYLLGCKIY